MSNPLVMVTLAGLGVIAVLDTSAPMFTAAVALAAGHFASRSAGLGTRLTVLVSSALAGGLLGEIGRTIFVHATVEAPAGTALFRDALIVAAACLAAVVTAIFCEYLWRRFARPD